MDFDNLNPPVFKTKPGNYPLPKCDPKKTIVYTTPAAANPIMGPDPSIVYRGTRPHRPPPSLSNPPTKYPYPQRTSSVKQPESLTQTNSSKQKSACPCVTQPNPQQPVPRRTASPQSTHPSRYPKHPLTQAGSVCSPATCVPNSYAFRLQRAARTNN